MARTPGSQPPATSARNPEGARQRTPWRSRGRKGKGRERGRERLAGDLGVSGKEPPLRRGKLSPTCGSYSELGQCKLEKRMSSAHIVNKHMF
jgi:hypothetical protein